MLSNFLILYHNDTTVPYCRFQMLSSDYLTLSQILKLNCYKLIYTLS